MKEAIFITWNEFENILLKHPGILDAAVVVVSHRLDNKHPIAFLTKALNSVVIILISIYFKILVDCSSYNIAINLKTEMVISLYENKLNANNLLNVVLISKFIYNEEV